MSTSLQLANLTISMILINVINTITIILNVNLGFHCDGLRFLHPVSTGQKVTEAVP